jgi:hypothetical protein
MKITYKNIAKRITGVSIPVFGISWTPPVLDRDIAKKLISFLEDRRALFYPYNMEVPYHVKESIMQIRAYITDQLQQIDNESALIPNLKSMRAACRKYLDENPKSDRRHRNFGTEDIISLGELRGVFGINLAEICVKFGVDLDSELEDILPVEDVK